MQYKNNLLQNKNAIVTGSGSGIGYATIQVFAENGANIWACAHKKNESFEYNLLQLAEKNQVWIRPIYFEMTDENQMKEAFLKIKKEKQKIDILINNAGISYDALLPMLSMKKSHELFEINFFAHIQFTQFVSRQMMREKQGSIVNVASYLGFDGNRGQTMYSASKAAINAMTKSLAKEFAEYGIRVNAIAPGVVDTKLIDTMSEGDFARAIEKCALHRIAEPIEIANMIMVLASDLSSYVTGEIVRVDGGM